MDTMAITAIAVHFAPNQFIGSDAILHSRRTLLTNPFAVSKIKKNISPIMAGLIMFGIKNIVLKIPLPLNEFFKRRIIRL